MHGQAEVIPMATTKPWTRWQDWLVVLLGVVAALAPLVVTVSTAAAWTLVVFGVLIAAAGLWSLAMPGSVVSEYFHLGLGVLLFVSPWVLGYTDLTGAAWTSWVVGALAVAAGAVALPEANTTHRGLAGQH